MGDALDTPTAGKTESGRRRRARRRRGSGVAFIATFFAGAVATILFAAAGLAALAAVDRLPAPPVNGTWCIDEKLAWMRAHRDLLDSGVIAVGSSVTWRNLNFDEIPLEAREAVGGAVNLAPCFLQINQTRSLTNFMLDFSPKTHTVISVVAPRDFEKCSTSTSDFFDRELLEGFLSGSISEWWVYFRNLKAVAFIKDVINLPKLSHELVFDEWGSGPLFDDHPIPFDPVTMEPGCFDELRLMATDLDRRGVKLVLVLFPYMPEWIESVDAGGEMQAAFRANVMKAISGTDITLIDATQMAIPTADFADQFHLRWSAVPAFTRHIWERAF